MSLGAYRGASGCLAVIAIGSSLIAGWLFVSSTWLNITVAFADDQTAIFEEMREKSLRSQSPQAAASFLSYVVGYYPSGTKQTSGSRIDQIVERNRAGAVREIIAHLRATTGVDLGDDPQLWIDAYARN